MVTKAQKFRLGIFITVISILMVMFLIMVAGTQILEKRDTYYIRYQNSSVTGLQIGGPVKYRGIGIGRVDDISIDPENITDIIVTASIEAGTPIKGDMKASLIPIGITGLVQVEISGGTQEAALLESGSFILPGLSTLESISGKAEVLASKFEILLNNLNNITNEENTKRLNNIIANVDTIIDVNQSSISNTVSSLEAITDDFEQIAENTKTLLMRLDEIMQSGQIEKIVTSTEKITSELAGSDLTQLMTDIHKLTVDANSAISHIDATHLESRQDLLDTIESLKETIDYLNDFSRQISEDPSLLIRSKN
ncbi:MAG: MCE family protein [Candidatus Cloacimonetes bacterium]|jgi:ABC-type transporter Mla subunit MlaD|nr:MCE family protein [Candidatus Cloacimonadota bacterium]MBT4576244.1 MCE family protein [Candidatus Cloacimonadota bacterium]MBT5419730.1 MCE family protein [Candidatus Cloacimonadota bacterium]